MDLFGWYGFRTTSLGEDRWTDWFFILKSEYNISPKLSLKLQTQSIKSVPLPIENRCIYSWFIPGVVVEFEPMRLPDKGWILLPLKIGFLVGMDSVSLTFKDLVFLSRKDLAWWYILRKLMEIKSHDPITHKRRHVLIIPSSCRTEFLPS